MVQGTVMACLQHQGGADGGEQGADAIDDGTASLHTRQHQWVGLRLHLCIMPSLYAR